MKTRSSDTPEHFETAPETPQTPELLAAQQEIDHLKAALDDMKILSQIQSGNYAALLNSQTHKEPTVATPSIVRVLSDAIPILQNAGDLSTIENFHFAM